MKRSLLATLLPFVHVVLSVMGLVMLVAAAFTLGAGVGLAAGGVALLVLAFYLETERSAP